MLSMTTYVVTSGHQLFVATRQHVNFSVHDVVNPRADRKSGARKIPSGWPKKCQSGGQKNRVPMATFGGPGWSTFGGRKVVGNPKKWLENTKTGGGWLLTQRPVAVFKFLTKNHRNAPQIDPVMGGPPFLLGLDGRKNGARKWPFSSLFVKFCTFFHFLSTFFWKI